MLLKANREYTPTLTHDVERKEEETFRDIKCPLCGWKPAASSRWCCDIGGTPEPPFDSCGTIWNTFATRGTCPGCQHRWRWTSCLACHRPSLHLDWYEEKQRPH